MKVLVLGSTGFIGKPVAQALVRAGHIVYGQTRSAAGAKQLSADEIIPIIGQPAAEVCLILVPQLDVIIDAIGGGDKGTMAGPILTAYSEAAQSRAAGTPKLSFIFTSGTWVFGENRLNIVSDTSATPTPVDLINWMPGHEKAVTNSTILNGIVIRPSMVYGRSGSLTALLFQEAIQAKEQSRKITFAGTSGGRFALIHQDDLGDCYLRIAERAVTLGGLSFIASNDVTESTDDLLQRLALLVGADGYQYRAPVNAFERALSTTAIIRPYLARSLVGWQPRKTGLLDGLEVYFAAFLASQK
ncbi:NAD(P)-binding protein [Mycena floridula]|nr:NAD(P)-binding protein [Mycena floridula]